MTNTTKPTFILAAVKFPLGVIVTTSNAHERLSPAAIVEGLRRHASGDWGDVCEQDSQENETAIREGFRLFSAYWYGGERFWVITEADRSVTTILMPQDY